MAKVKKIIVGNWKMNPGTAEDAKKIFKGICKKSETLKKTKTIICPPFIYISDLAKTAKKSVSLGAQNIFWELAGSFTGEVSSSMLKSVGGSYVILGHSERRALGETNEQINKKIIIALKEGLNIIFCIGEKERDNHGDYLEFLKIELSVGLNKVHREYLNKIIIAYEPVWAIGKSDKEAMVPRDMHEMSLYIRKVLIGLFGQDWVKNIPILYGGSISPRNAKEMIADGNTQGLLVGRDSLNVANFNEILEIADTV